MQNSAEQNNGNSEILFEVTQEDVLKYYKDILNFVNRRISGVNSHTDANDITQEVFIKAINSLHTLRRGVDLKSWLYKIADNKIKEFFRSRGAKKRGDDKTKSLEDLTNHGKSLSTNPESDYIEGLDNHKIAQYLLKRLNPKQRELLALKEINDASIKELAELLGTTELAIKTELYRIRQSLKDEFKNQAI